jgi:hypothetical protein
MFNTSCVQLHCTSCLNLILYFRKGYVLLAAAVLLGSGQCRGGRRQAGCVLHACSVLFVDSVLSLALTC